MKINKIILNGLWILVLFLVFAAPPVFALNCKDEIFAVHQLKVDQSSSLSASDWASVGKLINDALALCDSGDDTGVQQKLAEAKTILGVA